MLSNVVRVEFICIVASRCDDTLKFTLVVGAVIVLDLEILVSVASNEVTVLPVLNTLTTLQNTRYSYNNAQTQTSTKASLP